MPLTDVLARVRRASRKSPAQIARRLVEIGAEQLQRPWSSVYPHLLTPARVASAAGARSVDALWEAQQRVPFFLSPADRVRWSSEYRARYPNRAEAVVAAADRALRHEFDLLGSGCVNLGPRLPWHSDFKTGHEWPIEYSPDLDFQDLERPTDVKVPWELSRSQHFTALGQAYWLTGDDRYAQEFVAEVQDWIDRNPWNYGVNWVCAMDVALRAVSWMWGFYFMAGAPACASAAFRGQFLRALFLHGDHVAGHIERSDVNGNHYLCDAVGLLFVGAFFRSTAKGRQWLATGRAMLDAEIFNQTSSDGVDFEKSTAYHRLVLEAFVTCDILLARHGEPMPPGWRARLAQMIEFVEAYLKPDGGLPLIGDADDGRIQKLGTQEVNDHRYLLSTGAVIFGRAGFKSAAKSFADESFWLGGPDAAAAFDALPTSPAAVKSRAFPDGGFYILRSERAHVMIDCGEVGMLGRGGHGHNDILGFELWLDGLNLVTDCGAYLYTASREWRNRFRATGFHNVVQVDGEELNRFISPENLWQLHDDARPADVEWRVGDRVDYFRGSHTGYLRLTPPVTVTREVGLIKDGPDVFVRDTLGGDGVRDMIWRFHLDPQVKPTIEGRDVRLVTRGREAWLQVMTMPPTAEMTIEGGWSSPTYGVRHPIAVIVIRLKASLPQLGVFRFGLTQLTPGELHERLSEIAR